MSRLRIFLNKFFSLLEDNKPSEEQTNIVVKQNPLPQSYFDDNHEIISKDLSSKDDITDSTINEQENIVISSQDIEFSEIKPISTTEKIPTHEIEESSQNNASGANFDKLLANTIDMIKYYDQVAEQIQNQDIRTMLDDVCRKLIENLILSGCTPIDEPTGIYNMIKHKVKPFQIVPEGTYYTKLIRPGVEYNGEVKILAIVEL